MSSGRSSCAVWVLTIPEPNRAARLKSQLHSLGIRFAEVMGPDARTADFGDLLSRTDRQAARWALGASLSPTQLACALGHLKCAEAFLASGEQWGVILEEDAGIAESFVPALRWIQSLQVARPIVITLFAHGRIIGHRRSIEVVSEGRNLTLRRLLAPPAGAVGYALNRPAAQLANAQAMPLLHRADWLPWVSRANLYALTPWPVTHGDLGKHPGTTMTSSTYQDSFPRHALNLARARPYWRHPKVYFGSISLFLKHDLWPPAAYRLARLIGRKSTEGLWLL